MFDFEAFEESPSRSWVEMADEEEALMRELLEDKTMDVDLPRNDQGSDDQESSRRKPRKSTPRKSNSKPKYNF